MSAVVRPRFYLLVALALMGLVVVGFWRSYYHRILFDPPPLSTLMHLHAIVFTLWLGLFFVQAGLVANHRVDLHRRLGIASAGVAVMVVTVAVLAVFETAISNHRSPSGLAPAQFSIVGFVSIGLFAVFIALGIAYRKRAALHRRFMVLAMVASISPASARLLRLLDLQEYRNVLIPGIAALFIGACLVHDWRRYRVVHRVYAIGGAVIVASWPLRIMIGRSDWYFPVGEGVARIAHVLFR